MEHGKSEHPNVPSQKVQIKHMKGPITLHHMEELKLFCKYTARTRCHNSRDETRAPLLAKA